MKLPPLPEPAFPMSNRFEEDQLRAYGQAAYRQALEDAAKECHLIAVDQRVHPLTGKGAHRCAAAIRALKEKINE